MAITKPRANMKRALLWPAPAHFSDKVRQLWKTQLDNTPGGWSSTSALECQIETAQPVSFNPRLLKPGQKTAGL